jgi:hypothetical protein
MLPWKVGLEDCSARSEGTYTRALDPTLQGIDTRVWHVSAVHSPHDAYLISNNATGRCLTARPTSSTSAASPSPQSARVALLPCNTSEPSQFWSFDDGLHTVSSLTNVATGLALAVANATLRAVIHSPNGHVDAFATPDAAYGLPPLVLVPPYKQPPCTVRGCQDYDPTQKWYWSKGDGKLRHALFSASINDRVTGGGYQLTPKVPTWRHHCLAHVLSDENKGTESGHAEVWGGPLADGAFVIGLANRYTQPLNITAPFAALGMPSVGESSTFAVRDLWRRTSLGTATGRIHASVPPHDLALFKLSPS